MKRGHAHRRSLPGFGALLWIAAGGIAFACLSGAAFSQPVDCATLAARIAALDESGQAYTRRYGGAGQRLRADLDRAIRSARSLGCDRQYSAFDAQPPQCPGLNAQILQMQASVAQSQATAGPAGNSPAKQQLVASYNAYCRGQAQVQAPGQPRGFFETLFGVLTPHPNPAPFYPQPQNEGTESEPGGEVRAHGGSQALCVRNCDGSYFPLSLSAKQAEPDELTNLCQALCPNADVSVYTRAPYHDISTAVSLEGDVPYAEMPNALSFQKKYDPACTCKPAGQTWAEALGPAEQLLGHMRKSDIVVTPEKSDELAKPKSGKAIPEGRPTRPETAAEENPEDTGDGVADTQEVVGPGGVKRRVRIIVPPL